MGQVFLPDPIQRPERVAVEQTLNYSKVVVMAVRFKSLHYTNFYSKTNEMHQFLKFILFCSSTLHVSDSLSVHHQESKTVHTASGVCQTDFHLVPVSKQSGESV
jgi:hypothetical protein